MGIMMSCWRSWKCATGEASVDGGGVPESLDILLRDLNLQQALKWKEMGNGLHVRPYLSYALNFGLGTANNIKTEHIMNVRKL